MENAYVIIASQDYDKANHKLLWWQLAKQTRQPVVVVDIPADYIVSVLAHHKDRICEAKQGPRKITENLTVVRPLFLARPEILPDWMFPMVSKKLWSCLNGTIEDLNKYRVNFLIYDARWVKILNHTRENIRIAYYLFDEVRYNGKDATIDKKRFVFDEYACKFSNIVFTMTSVLAESRKKLNANIVVLGNGAEVPDANLTPKRKIENSVAFVGNFRNWIDEELLELIIQSMPDILFVFAGPVEDNMKTFLKVLLDTYSNTVYFGCCHKEDMGMLYRMFNCVIIPYRKNEFIKATRPIKIVEAVLAGTPVVTVPINGYQQTDFIRFASDKNEFIKQIRWVIKHPIRINEKNYIDFVNNNMWSQKARIILEKLDAIPGSDSAELI